MMINTCHQRWPRVVLTLAAYIVLDLLIRLFPKRLLPPRLGEYFLSPYAQASSLVTFPRQNISSLHFELRQSSFSLNPVEPFPPHPPNLHPRRVSFSILSLRFSASEKRIPH